VRSQAQQQIPDRGGLGQERVVSGVEADDFDEAVTFYRDVLGLPEVASFEAGDDARVCILDAGRATLQLANPAQRRMIGQVEVGSPTTGRIRVAFEVADAEERTGRLVEHGARLVARPTGRRGSPSTPGSTRPQGCTSPCSRS
jgi:catechol 2,3-dioxygenase-like lactoylglutathione lyase family enzyme